MYSNSRVVRSNNTPDYILDQIQRKDEEMKKTAAVEQQVSFEDQYKTGKIKYAIASKKVAFVDHGFGVLENPDDGVVWYRSGDTIYRKDDEHVKAVLDAIERGEEIEEISGGNR